MPSLIAFGTLAQSAATVVEPTALAPGLPTTRTVGDWMLCPTMCTKPTAAVATPAGWQSVCNVSGTNGRLALFAKKVVGGETAPTVTWSGLTAGATGTPCDAHIVNMGTGFGEDAGLLIVDALGAASSTAASTTVMDGGSGITTASTNAVVLAMGVRLDDAATGISEVGTGLTWQGIFADQSTSGSDMLTAMSWGEKNPAGAIGAHQWAITGGVSAASTGVMLALQPTTDVVPLLVQGRSPVRSRSSF